MCSASWAGRITEREREREGEKGGSTFAAAQRFLSAFISFIKKKTEYKKLCVEWNEMHFINAAQDDDDDDDDDHNNAVRNDVELQGSSSWGAQVQGRSVASSMCA